MPSLSGLCGAFCGSASGVLVGHDFANAAHDGMDAGAASVLEPKARPSGNDMKP